MADPASIRYWNPGGQYPGNISRRWGSTGHATIGGGHLIAQFPDAVSGAAAQFDLLRGSGYAGRSLADAITRWSGGNNSAAYVAHLTRATGLAPESVITPELLSGPQGLALARAMAHWEAGRPYPMTDDQWREAQARVFGGQGGPPAPAVTAMPLAPRSVDGAQTPAPSVTPPPADISSIVAGLFGQGQGQAPASQAPATPGPSLAQQAAAAAAVDDMQPMQIRPLQFAPMALPMAPRRPAGQLHPTPWRA